MELKQLIDTLAILLSSDLGTLQNGQPALVVNYGDIPQGKITGLACFVSPSPTVNRSYFVTGGMKFYREYWQLALVQYDRKKTTRQAAYKIHDAFRVVVDDLQTVTASTPEQRVIQLLFEGFL